MLRLEHSSHSAHECPKSDHNSIMVVVCDSYSISIKTKGCNEDDEKALLERCERSEEKKYLS